MRHTRHYTELNAIKKLRNKAVVQFPIAIQNRPTTLTSTGTTCTNSKVTQWYWYMRM